MAHVEVQRRSMSFDDWANNMFSQIQKLTIEISVPTDKWEVRHGYYKPDGYEWRDEFQAIEDDDRWGGPDVTALFRTEIVIPEVLEGQTVHFQMLTATEVLVSSKGKYLDGLDPNRQWLCLSEIAKSGDRYPIEMEAYTRSRPDDDRNPRSASLRGCIQRFNKPRLVVLNQQALEVMYDLEVLYMTAFGNSINGDVKEYLQKKIRELLKIFPPFDCPVKELQTALPSIKSFLDEHIYGADSPYGKEGRLACVAHSHLDIAYFWKTPQTVQKNARTALIQLRLMERYPEFSYAHTQAWTYENLEKYYPDIFSEMKERILEGRWEIVGGLYVEPDCNVISAESLVRQIVYGKFYFLEKFGVEVDNCWLPDVFGNSPIMPQILKQGGIDFFVSNKMSTWNDTNRFPHNNFTWRGIDGTDINACVPPVHFITWMDPNQAVENWESMQDKEIFPESLQMYGYGDGGSGATDEMIEHFHRQQKLPGIPQQRLTSGKEYLHSAFDGKKDLPVWDGDLYLEMHRGTFTTKGELKKGNRKGEFLLSEVELLCTLSALRGDSVYPISAIRDAWKKLLLNQFHDILPGSHVAPVTVETLQDYETMSKTLEELKNKAIDGLTENDEDSLFIQNISSWERSGLALIESGNSSVCPIYEDKEGHSYHSQKLASADGGDRWSVEIPNLGGFSSVSLKKAADRDRTDIDSSFHISSECLENRFFRMDFDQRGNLLQIFDKERNRNIAPGGEILNDWHLYEDRPGRYNAWDILDRYLDKEIEIQKGWDSVQLAEEGPLSIALKLERTFGDSRAVQIIRIFKDVARIDFETWVDWHETERLLKVSFPLEVKARYYSTDLSAGVFQLPNHRNTSWEQAHFESLCHKWVDLSEGLFGVALMNDCKYGCDVRENVVSLSLLRAPTRPDRNSDRGEHLFSYSLFPHNGQWQKAGLVEEAYSLNQPLPAYLGKKSAIPGKGTEPFFIVSTGVKAQAVKMAEDGSGDLIIRLLETLGSHEKAEIRMEVPFEDICLCDLLERSQAEALAVIDGTVSMDFHPFEIKTVRVGMGLKK